MFQHVNYECLLALQGTDLLYIAL